GEVTSLNSAMSIAKSAMSASKNGADSRALVIIKADVSKQLLMNIEKLGGKVENTTAGAIRARLSLDSLETLAGDPAVRHISSAELMATTHSQVTGSNVLNGRAAPLGINGVRPNFNQRAMNVRAQLTAALAKARAGAKAPNPLSNVGLDQLNHLLEPKPGVEAQDATTNAGSVTSQGDVAHNVAAARNFFGVSGTGVKIGVLSDSVDFLAQSVATGNLPPDVTVLPGQSGVPGSGEGTAMLEIVHDMAPGAKLFFATAFNSIESFADNIRALRAAGCDIIVDDILYFAESPFHDDIVTTAVNDVIADGALYFSSAGNEGNFDDGTSGTWEGDFKNSRTTLPSLPGGTLHDFGSGVISNFVEVGGLVTTLHWSDPLGASDNDYDFFIMNNTLTTVLDASTEVQDGDDDPFEITFGAPGGSRILIFKADGAQRRAINLCNFLGELGIATSGTIRGHAAAAGAFAVAAVDVALAGDGSVSRGPPQPPPALPSAAHRPLFFNFDRPP